MNKRHLAVFISIGLLIGIAVLVLMIRAGGARDAAPLLVTGDKPAVSGHIKSLKTKDWMSEPAIASEKPGLTAIKPKSIKMDQGATAVIEIDHGLQAVDLTKGDRYSAAVDKACDKGAQGAVTFSVVDDRGQPVPGATVKAAFSNHRMAGHDFEKTTDENGLVALQDTCVGDLNFRITKDGHYDTRLRYWFFKAWFDCVKDGRWIPWNPVIEIVLKRKVNPVAMYVHNGIDTIKVPKHGEFIGMDMEYGDWIAPYGKGKVADFLACFDVDAKDDAWSEFKTTFTLRFLPPYNGCYRMKKDMESQLASVYSADIAHLFDTEVSFISERKFDSGTQCVFAHNNRLGDDEYLVLRTRSVIDENGTLIKANYSKIYGELLAAKYGLRINYYFNPNENDPNLEADTSRNLLNPRDLGFAP